MKTGGGGGSRTRVPTQLTMTSTCLFREKLLIVPTFRPRTDTGTDYAPLKSRPRPDARADGPER